MLIGINGLRIKPYGGCHVKTTVHCSHSIDDIPKFLLVTNIGTTGLEAPDIYAQTDCLQAGTIVY